MPSFVTVWKADGAAVPSFVEPLGVGLGRSRRSVRSVGRSRQWGRSVGRSVSRLAHGPEMSHTGLEKSGRKSFDHVKCNIIIWSAILELFAL